MRSFAAAASRFPALAGPVEALRRVRRERRQRALWAACPLDPASVLFESYDGRGYACSPRALYQAMLRDPRFDHVEKVWALRAAAVRALERRGGYDVRGLDDIAAGPELEGDLETVFGAEALEELRHAVIVPWRSAACRRAFARAGLSICNTMAPSHATVRPGQLYLQTWHGTPLKRLGCDIPSETSGSAGLSVAEIHGRYSRDGVRFTWLVSPSPYATEKLGSAFDLASRGRAGAIVEEGYPRNDFLRTFTADDVTRIKARLHIPSGKKVVLYAPTWRENQHTEGVGYTFETELDFDALRAALGDGYVVLFRTHCLVSSVLDLDSYGGFVVDVSAVDDVNDLYVISDVLVTDYSSVFFDYANLMRPTVFYMPDLEEYSSTIRGLYLALDELPGPVTHTTTALIDALRAAERPSAAEFEGRARFRERFAPLDDGHASERVIQRMLAEGALRPTVAGTGAEGGSTS